MAIPESKEVYCERLANLFTAWIEFYQKRYSTVFTDEYMKMLEDNMIELLQEETREEIREGIRYLLTTVLGRVLESLDKNVRASITGVQMPPEE